MRVNELTRVMVVPLKGTSEADIMKLQPTNNGLQNRTRTVDAFMKREALEGMVISLNQPDSKLNLTERPTTPNGSAVCVRAVKQKVSRYLQEKARRIMKPHMRCIDLWGESHYTNVMKHSHLTNEFFLEHHHEIP